MQPPQPFPGPGYQQPHLPPPPPPRRRTGLVAAVMVGCLVLVGAVVALALVLSDNDSEDGSGGGSGSAAAPGGGSGMAPKSSAAKAVQAPPRACELLSPPQLAAILPGKVKDPFSQDPEPSGEGQISTRCIWSNVTSVNGQRFPSVTVNLLVTATSTEDIARTAFQYTVKCDEAAAKRIQLTGADEACLQHGAFDVSTKAPVGNAVVTARRGTTVIMFHYANTGMPIEAIDNIAGTGAASVLAAIGQPR